MGELLQHLSKLESDLHHPGVRCSRSRLEELLHADFWEIGRSGRRYEREFVMDVLVSETQRPLVQASQYAVTRLGENSALLTYQSAHVGPDGALERHTHRSSVWQFADARWQLLYHQGTPAEHG
jgi:hypothetical protein